MNNYKSNNHVPALADTLDNSINNFYKDSVNNINNIKKDIQFIKAAHIDPILEGINYNIKGTIKNMQKNPFKSATQLGFVGIGLFMGVKAYEFLTKIDANPQGQYLFVNSNSEAAELQQKTYQIFENQIDAIKYANENMWNMAQEKVFNENPEFKEFEEKFNSFLNYPNPNHKILMDINKLKSIKLTSLGETDGSYETVLYVGNLKPENALKTGKIFNIPKSVNLEQYMNNLLKDTYHFNNEYQELIEKRDAEKPTETVEDKVMENQQKIISKAQEAKQRTIDNYVSRNLASVGNIIEIFDLDRFKVISNVYRVQDADEMLRKLDIPKNASLSHVKFDGINIYNIVLDYNNLDDGNSEITDTKDGFKSLFDVPEGEKGRKVVSRIQESRLEDLVLTDDVGAVVSNILANKKNDYYIIRDLEDGKPSFGIVGVPVDMKVKVGEILAKYVDGVKQDYDGAIFEFPEVKRDVGDSGTPVTPVEPVIPPIYIPPTTDQCDDTGNFDDNADTGNPDDTSGDSATEDVDVPLPDFTI